MNGRKIAAFTYFLLALSFLIFIWLSHANVLKGGASVEGWSGVAIFIIALGAYTQLCDIFEKKKAIFEKSLIFTISLLTVFSSVLFFILFAGGLIGPKFEGFSSDDKLTWVSFLSIFYIVLAYRGIFQIKELIDD